ncbi:MAG: hypothetical protein KJ622_00860 [Alphaproteobacteria bacterium]|nr:hypothetical protein [Alphaproteobacteria bacterium]
MFSFARVLALGFVFTFVVQMAVSDAKAFEGDCHDGLKWTGSASSDGAGTALLEACGANKPLAPLIFRCSATQPNVQVSLPLIQKLPKMVRGPFPVSLYANEANAGGGQTTTQVRLFQAMIEYTSGKGRLVFTIPRNDPLLNVYTTGSSGRVVAFAKSMDFHLQGAGDAIAEMRVGCGL